MLDLATIVADFATGLKRGDSSSPHSANVAFS
jgi:hypothetical protein